MQNKFAFFANFAETIKTLPKEIQPRAYQAVCEFGIYGTLPDDILLKSICLMAKNSIYKDWGGAPLGNKNALKKQPQNNPETTQKQPDILEKQETETETETETEDETEAETETENETEAETEAETETEAEAEAETEAETENKNSGKPPFGRKGEKYAFEGKVIRLTQADFDRWRRAYPDLNLWGELMLRDDWLAKQSPDEQKSWFMSTSQYFIKQNEKRKKQNAKLGDFENEPTGGRNEKKEHDWSWV